MKIKMLTKKICMNPQSIWCSLGNHHLLNWIPDEYYLKLIYKARTGQKLNLINPQGYNEKLQWIKLYDRRPEYTIMVDKYTVRGYVEKKIGDEYLIPLLGVWDNPEEIEVDKLPEQFVLKCTHDSGSIQICRDKKNFDISSAKKTLKNRIKKGTYWATREWPYKNVKARVIAEKYMEDESQKELKDYKVLCFNGQPRLIQLHRGRYSEHTQDFYDTKWNKTNITQGLPLSSEIISKPECFAEMLELSSVLSQGIPHVRVDWYCISGKLYFGEMTFFDGSGFLLYDDPEIERKVGEWIHLPSR